MSKVLVVGTGFLGSQVATHFQAESLGHSDLDITDLAAVRAVLALSSAEVIINVAAATNTAALEKPENQAAGFQGNVQGPANLALACKESGKRLVHYSTGMMFDGLGPDETGWRETDLPEPTSYYAWSKAVGDQALSPWCQRDGALIIRLHMPISGNPHPRNLLNKLLSFDRVVDVASSMTVVEELLVATSALIEQEKTGIYNVVNPGLLSCYEMVEMLQAAGLVPVEKQVGRIHREELDGMGGAKQAFPLLNTEKLQATGVHLPEIRQAVSRCIEQLQLTLG
jgi:dTDP-4-dehydrorhamnose reductase